MKKKEIIASVRFRSHPEKSYKNISGMDVVGIEKMNEIIEYPKKAPFNPPKIYPELAELKIVDETKAINSIDKSNQVYPLVRHLFHSMELDINNFGKPEWNPLGNIIKKGDTVVIKPNWVLDKSQYDINALITHMSIIRPLIDYAWMACGSTGKISILESPIQNTNWDNLMKVTQAEKTVNYLKSKGVNIELQDIRTETFIEKNILNLFGWRLKIFYRQKLKGTKKGYVKIDLGSNSALHEIRDKSYKFRGIQQWTSKETSIAHNEKNHIYSIPQEILDADVFINIPKLKTHRKAGVTLALKNLVGMVNNKDWLPHYVKGTPAEGGDEAPSDMQLYVRLIDSVSMIQFFKKFGFSIRPPNIEKLWRKKIESDLHKLKNVRQANWHGGDTVWRMVYDLNTILFHADKTGKLKKNMQRRYLAVIDGIIGGEKFGPLDSRPKKSGLIIAGMDPLYVDFIGTRVMGFDDRKIKSLSNANKVNEFYFGSSNYSKVKIGSRDLKWQMLLTNPKLVSQKFIPAPGWEGYIELNK